MIIDIHNHPDWEGYDLTRFIANMDLRGIDKSCILTWEIPSDEYDVATVTHNSMADGYPVAFSRCLSYVERAPKRFILGYAPDPRDPRALGKLEAAVRIYGVRIYGELKLRMTYDTPDALRVFRFCGKEGLPVLVHIDYEFPLSAGSLWPTYWYGGGIEAFERAIRACPRTAFIGHAPGFWAHISGDDKYDKVGYPDGPILPGGKLVTMLRQYPNLFCDISAGSGLNALKRDPGFTKGFLMEFQDRILYGRDDFDNNHQELLRTLDLPADVLGKILGVNAMKLLGEK